MVFIVIAVLILPAIQKETAFVKVRKLDGDFLLAEKPAFSWTGWFEGSYQSACDKYLEDHIGFRDFLVRLTNQLDFDLFRVPHADGIVVGKKDQLFEYDYIRAYTGEDYIGEEMIDLKIRKLKYIQEYLKEKKGIDLVLVFEPGKASFYPECIPDKYLDQVSPKTNFDSFLSKAIEHQVQFIDLRNWFISMKGTKAFPLYPQYGIHWSIYGMNFAADSLLSYIETIRKIDLPEYYIDSLQIEKNARRPDYDIGKTLNLLFRLPEKNKLAYPVYRFDENSEKEKPMVLAVADSYYWNIFNTRIPKYLFQNVAFWYFGKQIYPESYIEPKTLEDINLQEEIEKQEVIFLMVTERFLFKFGWNFIENVYKLYGPTSIYDRTHDYKCNISNYDVWFSGLIKQARARNISLAEMLEINAEYVYSQDNIEDFLMYKGESYYEEIIRNDHPWYKNLKSKAIEDRIPIDELLHQEAVYNFQTNFPDIYTKYNNLEDYKSNIRNDSLLLNDVQLFAQQYNLTLDEAIQIKAERMFKDAHTD